MFENDFGKKSCSRRDFLNCGSTLISFSMFGASRSSAAEGNGDKVALVLGGGALKGAFQAGALEAIFKKGFKPYWIYGVSVGALNAAYLVSAAGAQLANGANQIDWEKAGSDLSVLWKTKVTKPQDIRTENYLVELANEDFGGLNDIGPLQALMNEEIKKEHIKLASKAVNLRIGAVNINSGKIEYADSNHPKVFEMVIASLSLPIIFPVAKAGNDYFVDGGVRDVIPLRKAVNEGMNRVVAVALQPEEDGYIAIKGNGKSASATDILLRTIDIMGTEIIANDLEDAKMRGCKVSLIRPEKTINLDIDDFSQEEIVKIWKMGFERAKDVPLPCVG